MSVVGVSVEGSRGADQFGEVMAHISDNAREREVELLQGRVLVLEGLVQELGAKVDVMGEALESAAMLLGYKSRRSVVDSGE